MRLALLAAIVLVSCGPQPTLEQRVIQTAYEHAVERFHYEGDIERLPPTVKDQGENWLIIFHIPPEMAGGAPMVEVRKSDLAVIGSVSSQ